MGAGVNLPDGIEPLTALHVAERYVKIIDENSLEFMNDYGDELEFRPSSPNVFQLKYIPAQGNLRFYVNGVFYDLAEEFYELDREGKTLTWKFPADKGGFDLKPHFRYLAVYDVYYEENGLNPFPVVP